MPSVALWKVGFKRETWVVCVVNNEQPAALFYGQAMQRRVHRRFCSCGVVEIEKSTHTAETLFELDFRATVEVKDTPKAWRTTR